MAQVILRRYESLEDIMSVVTLQAFYLDKGVQGER